jgi:hypothetical protein
MRGALRRKVAGGGLTVAIPRVIVPTNLHIETVWAAIVTVPRGCERLGCSLYQRFLRRGVVCWQCRLTCVQRLEDCGDAAGFIRNRHYSFGEISMAQASPHNAEKSTCQ